MNSRPDYACLVAELTCVVRDATAVSKPDFEVHGGRIGDVNTVSAHKYNNSCDPFPRTARFPSQVTRGERQAMNRDAGRSKTLTLVAS